MKPDEMTDRGTARDGAELLDDVLGALKRYVVLDEHAAVGSALWIATTHALPAFDFAPRLAIVSPQKCCRKTRLLDVIEHTAHNPLATSNATVATLFRSIGGGHPPALIFDEADTVFGSKKAAENHEDLWNLFNNGFQRGRETLRCVGPNQVPTKCPIFAMAALAGIGALPDTITDRAINIAMWRRAPGETVKPFRLRRDGPKLAAVRDRLAQWAAAHLDILTAAEPSMPVEDGRCCFGLLGVEAGEVVATGIVVGGVGGGDMPDCGEQRAVNGDVGLEGAAAGGNAAVFGGRVGVMGVGDRDRCGAEGAVQIGVGRSGATGFGLAGRFVVAGGGARSRCEVLGGGESGYVGSGFSGDAISGEAADGGDGAD